MNTSFSQDYFATTRWSLVNAANSQSPRAESALDELCHSYWFPLYAYVRHAGIAHADAEDLVQGFFISQFLETNFLRDLNSRKGLFRAYLIACFKNYSRNEWKRARRKKRGGGAEHLPIDFDEKYQSLKTAETPDKIYDRAWVVTLLERVRMQLGQEMHAKGQRELFEVLKPTWALDGDKLSYREAAKRLNMSEDALRKNAERLRKRYKELIIQEIRETCDPAWVEEEIRWLLKVFSDD